MGLRGDLDPLEAMRRCLDGYQGPVPPDIMEFQMRLAVREATDLGFVAPAFRHLAGPERTDQREPGGERSGA
jgi:hypothetical protein